MPPILKKLIAVAVIVILVNIGFIKYGEASFNADFQQLAKAFNDNNATLPRAASLPAPVARFFKTALADANASYRTVVLEFDGVRFKKPDDKGAPMRALTLLRPTPDMLRATKVESTLVTFHALETYHGGRARMKTLLFGLIPTADFTSEAFARSELARVLAYGVFNPAILACECVTYEEVGDNRVRATIHDGNLSATVTFLFAPDGSIAAAESADTVRPTRSGEKPARWRLDLGPLGGDPGTLRLPQKAEESWIDEKGRFVYARYKIRHSSL